MAWARYSHARISRTNPRALGCCDKCGFDYNLDQLRMQDQWQGPRLVALGSLVCDSCYDIPQINLKTIILPPDPIPMQNPRQDPYMLMTQSSAPNAFASGQPNVLTTISTISSSGAGNWLVTEGSSNLLITEITVTPTPTSSGYTASSS